MLTGESSQANAEQLTSRNNSSGSKLITGSLQYLLDLTLFSMTQLLVCLAAAFVAGLVRGFAGFGLSALIMAGAVFLIPPVELIPICFILEAVAGLMMVRGGMRDANMSIVWGLVIGSTIGFPIGLWATTSLPSETSKLLALIIVLGLSIAQLFRASPSFLATRPGLYTSGVVAGIAGGIAHVGGMVVALYVLARDAPARSMRASLVMYLCISLLTTLVFQLGFGIMDNLAVKRSMVLTPICCVGVMIGAAFFRPSMEGHYKRFCLTLLISLAAASLVRLLFSAA